MKIISIFNILSLKYENRYNVCIGPNMFGFKTCGAIYACVQDNDKITLKKSKNPISIFIYATFRYDCFLSFNIWIIGQLKMIIDGDQKLIYWKLHCTELLYMYIM